MSSIGSINSARLYTLQSSSGKSPSLKIQSRDNDNDEALRELQNYRLKNNKFSSGFKNVLKRLNSATSVLSNSGVSSTRNSSTAQVTYNYDSAVNSAKDFVEAYNDTIDYLKKNRRLSGVSNVLDDYKGTRNMQQQLERVGITVDSSGKLTIDEEAMTKALKEDKDIWHEVMNTAESSLAVRINKRTKSYINITDSILTKPTLILNA